ncbi:MAG: LuxR C-terminal-related transcriptional regulator [Bacteroidota bacterium]
MDNVWNTQMHWLTAVLIFIEFNFFVVQLYHFLNRPTDRQRLWYLLLLGLLIKFNVSNSLLPDPSFKLDIRVQYMIAYGFAYLTGAYFPFYFYKAYGLKELRFHATWGVTLFTLLPYLIFNVLIYALNGKLVPDRELGVLVPAAYGLVVLGLMLRAIFRKFRLGGNSRQFRCEILVWLAVIPWEASCVFAFYPVAQWLRILLANLGWLVITVLQFDKGIRSNHHRDRRLRELTHEISAEEYEARCRELPVSERELDVVLLFREEMTAKEMAERLFISELTVRTHITNILRKTGYASRRDLLRYILTAKN